MQPSLRFNCVMTPIQAAQSTAEQREARGWARKFEAGERGCRSGEDNTIGSRQVSQQIASIRLTLKVFNGETGRAETGALGPAKILPLRRGLQ